jgi:ParB-like chromosome segregation protein Spo0J
MPTLHHIDIKRLTLPKSNPRSLDKSALQKLCDSITADPDFLECRPILVHKQGDTLTVYAGSQRVRAAKKLGWKQAPCIIEEDLDPAIIKRRTVLDNLHAGEWDYDLLSAEYDPLELLALGMLESDLHLDIDDEKGPVTEKDDTIENNCPTCGQQIKKRKKR